MVSVPCAHRAHHPIHFSLFKVVLKTMENLLFSFSKDYVMDIINERWAY